MPSKSRVGQRMTIIYHSQSIQFGKYIAVERKQPRSYNPCKLNNINLNPSLTIMNISVTEVTHELGIQVVVTVTSQHSKHKHAQCSSPQEPNQ